jgi:hypothetical protein
MTTTPEHDLKIAKMTLASVYPHYVNKVVKKGRTESELLTVITWLTGHNEEAIKQIIEHQATLKEMFETAKLHPNASLITGTICGYRIEDIQTRLTREVRYLDKLVDELAKGRSMEKIMR